MAAPIVRRVIKFAGWLVLALAVLLAGVIALNWDTVRRTVLGGYHTHEVEPPDLPAGLQGSAVLAFSKTNAFRHEDAIPAANQLLKDIANARGWGFFATENSAVFSPQILSRFDAVVFNNVSGDSLSEAQEAALRAFIEGGGGFVGIHAAGDGSIPWDWYRERVIGAKFTGHPMDPQFQLARVEVESADHPSTRGLPPAWNRTDEWYSFEASPRAAGVHILLALDEASFPNHKAFGKDLAMGSDHPIAWWRCTGSGRVFYTAMGHQASAYGEPEMAAMLAGALDWTMGKQRPDCPAAR
ncbi:ThuA domain-containing protein [Novosphingobium sp. KN65.2]|uniref:ThuA domain-containing protein n=1 Tax=Novosphingobium sp. KN65.2 TaxID=1478134 RepID=UPI0005DCD811|nr:ThuA domain-containing protein [Novosphingobium sp. KN65.2]CDO34441.1 conserved exported hypothetical protein [Novosphingobium sp. KN65.2]